MGFKAGIQADYVNSMAEAMEKAFMAEWPKAMNDQPPPQANDQMRLLFIAIAQGVVRHLVDHPEAIAVTISENNLHTHNATVQVISTETLY
ncbi:hypothetical protein [Chitinophaga sp. CF418]|uniref:hypothetical protein n=1 Tax=Chitinophaga sp. CF418 TaxID=1855287 RepID=UPI00090FCB05|nr:hypothetical protein [Chitinophaga sp. CF418]SHN40804.1 hypothetical protein SAMN05216311_112112 [Chitinophaga sp. CF418]